MNTKLAITNLASHRLTRGLVAAAGAVGLLCAAAPARADDAATTIASTAWTILDEYVPGSGTFLSSITGLSGNATVSLSEESFEQIESIVEDALATYQWEQYSAEAEAAIGYASQYVRLSGSPSVSWTDVSLILNNTTLSLEQMESVGLQGTPTYMLVSALHLQFLEEKAELAVLLGDASASSTLLSLRQTAAGEHLSHLVDMWYAWDTATNDLAKLFRTNSKVCFDYDHCYSTYEAASAARDSIKLGGGRSSVLGEDFDAYLTALQAIAGDTRDLDGQAIVATNNTGMCINKKYTAFDNGNAVHLWSCSDSAAQSKTFIYDAENQYIRFAEDTSKCLQKKDSGWSNGNAIHVWDCDQGSDDNKQWIFDGGYIKAKNNTSKCLQKKYSGWSNGNAIHLWDCSAGSEDNKKWSLQ